MFRRVFSLFTFGLLAAAAMRAEASQPIQAAVPFSFQISSATFAPGLYEIKFDRSSQLLSVRGIRQTRGSAFVTAIPIGLSKAHGEPGSLLFQCANGNCYLQTVSRGGESREELQLMEITKHRMPMDVRAIPVPEIVK